MTLAAILAERLRRADGCALPAEDEEHWVVPPDRGFIPAAVLVAFIDHPQPSLLLTRRQAHLRSHAGQVAFPGGRADPDDADAIATALREAQEEVALPPAVVDVIGTAPPFRTGTGYVITPVLAVIPPALSLVADPGEVAHMFEARCDHLFDPARLDRRAVEWQGATRHYWETHVDGERVWGVTAGMIRAIGRLLRLDEDPAALNRAAVR